MSETKTIVGTCQGITEKPSGWTEVEIHVDGQQYPYRLATKLAELITSARETKGAVATWTYKEVESDRVNPNSGKPYRNRYLEGVELGDTRPAPPEAHHDPIHFADKDRAITRMACLKAAADVTARFPIGTEDPALVCMQIAARFERWIYRDIDPVPFSDPAPDGPLADSVREEMERQLDADLEAVPF